MRTKLGLVLLVASCTSSSTTDFKLPSASLTPRADTATMTVACGDAIAWDGDATPDLTYAFSYNASGELTHADGVYAAGGPDDQIDYTWDANGDFTHMNESNGSYQSTINETYDPTNGLTDYATSWSSQGQSDAWDYAMSAFVAPWQPGREVITEAGQSAYGYTLDYDTDGRLTEAVPDTGDATSYTYDDQGLTVTVDTGNGAFHGVITYDSDGAELSEVWGGTDPSAIASSDVYAWNGDALETATYSSGTDAAPQTLTVYEVDTMQYACPAARKAGATRALRPARAVHASIGQR